VRLLQNVARFVTDILLLHSLCTLSTVYFVKRYANKFCQHFTLLENDFLAKLQQFLTYVENISLSQREVCLFLCMYVCMYVGR